MEIQTKQPRTTSNESRPLVTFALFAYNQERFIREAVEGAFSQTYSPLEIILSDDCSSDETFEIMKEMAAKYEGPNKVILNRNDNNLGISGHINKLMEISSGELIVGAAGDDISFDQRVEITVEKWIDNQKKPMSLFSCVNCIDENGNFLNLWNDHKKEFNINDFVLNHNYIIGSSHAWARAVFNFFGPLEEDVVNEDIVIPLRSLLLSSILYIDYPLVNYRLRGPGNSVSHLNIDIGNKLDILSSFKTIYARQKAISFQHYLDLKKHDSLCLKKYKMNALKRFYRYKYAHDCVGNYGKFLYKDFLSTIVKTRDFFVCKVSVQFLFFNFYIFYKRLKYNKFFNFLKS